MRKVLFAAAALVIAATVTMAFVIPSEKTVAVPAKPFVETGKWALDKSHSSVKFTVTHMVVSEVDGHFKLFDGTMENSKADLSDAKINFIVDVNSVDTDNEKRDGHLKGDDFFNAAKFPTMKFASTSMKALGDNNYELAGDLTIRDVTKPVVFAVTYGGSTAANGSTKIGFKAQTTINRFDYNLKWDKATESGGLVVSKEVEITVNAQLNKVKE